MKEVPKFSVVIPVYNTISELKRCVNSAREQSFENIEIILIDDGSTDGSDKLCDELSAIDHRVICHHKKNGGAPDARNHGIQMASGEYILFLDSDDYWDNKHALEDIKNIIDNDNTIDVICLGTEICNEFGQLEKVRNVSLPNIDNINQEMLIRHLVYKNEYISASYVKVVKRELLTKHNILFKQDLLSGEDIEWSGRVLVHSKKMWVYPNVFYKRVRRSTGSITSNIGKKNVLDVLSAIETGIQYVNNYCENESMKAIYFEYWAYQYAMLFGLLGGLKKDIDFEVMLKRMQKLKWLLKYDHYRKVRLVGMIYKVLGMKSTIHLISKYYKIR